MSDGGVGRAIFSANTKKIMELSLRLGRGVFSLLLEYQPHHKLAGGGN